MISHCFSPYTWHPTFTFAFFIIVTLWYICCSSLGLSLSITYTIRRWFNPQVVLTAKAGSAHLMSLDCMFQPILAGHCVDDRSLYVETLIVPALDPFYYLDFLQTTKRRVPLISNYMNDVMRRPSPVQEFFEYPSSVHLTSANAQALAPSSLIRISVKSTSRHQRKGWTAVSPCILSAPWIRRLLHMRPQWLQMESFANSRTGTTTSVIRQENQAKMVQCLISVLVYMSAAIKSLPEFTDDYHPVLCTALEYMGGVLMPWTLQIKKVLIC